MADEPRLPEAKLLRAPLAARLSAFVRHRLRQGVASVAPALGHPVTIVACLIFVCFSFGMFMRSDGDDAPLPACTLSELRPIDDIVSAADLGDGRWVFVVKSGDGHETLELRRLFMEALDEDAPPERPVSLELRSAKPGCHDCCYMGTLHFHSTPRGRDLDAISRAHLFE